MSVVGGRPPALQPAGGKGAWRADASTLRFINSFAALFAAYLLAASVGLQWAVASGAASPVWPAAGIALAMLYLGDRRAWPAVALAMVAAYQLTGADLPLFAQLLIGIDDGLAALVGAKLLDRLAGSQVALRRVGEVGWLIAAGAIASAVAAVLGSGAIVLSEGAAAADFQTLVAAWFFGNATGIMLVVPLALTWRRGAREPWGGSRLSHLAAVLAVTGVLSWLLFFGFSLARAWAIYPPLVWAALVLRAQGTSLALAAVAVVATAGTLLDLGPFGGAGSRGPDLVLLQQFLTVTSATILVLAAAVDERDANARLRDAVSKELAAREELHRTIGLLDVIGSAVPSLIYAKDLDGRFLYANQALAELYGTSSDDLVGKTDFDFAAKAEAERYRAADQRVVATGKVEELEEQFSPPGAEARTFYSVKAPLRDQEGQVTGIVGITSDISELRAAEQRELLLAREVDHRAKNLLAVVQSIVQLTPASSGEELKTSLIGRIQALARAHSLLSDSRWQGVDLGQLVEDELAPYAAPDDPRVARGGPTVTLRPAAAQSLGLVIHELTTNAAKYGALSTQSGRLDLHWTQERDESGEFVCIDWRELAGRPVQAPATTGFGSQIIRASIDRQLRGKVTKQWTPEGLRCTIKIPVAEVVGSRP